MKLPEPWSIAYICPKFDNYYLVAPHRLGATKKYTSKDEWEVLDGLLVMKVEKSERDVLKIAHSKTERYVPIRTTYYNEVTPELVVDLLDQHAKKLGLKETVIGRFSTKVPSAYSEKYYIVPGYSTFLRQRSLDLL